MECRLIVRRVRRLRPLASDGTEQGELFATYRHHALITNCTLGIVEADQRHRDHAIVDQVIAELKDGPLAHLPSGKYAPNAAWVALATIAFNLARTARRILKRHVVDVVYRAMHADQETWTHHVARCRQGA